jgi:hypothetical protein
MKKIHFKLLFWLHKLKQFLGLKDKNNCVIKIWWDDKAQDTMLYANVRCGGWSMPVGRACRGGKFLYSQWGFSLVKTYEYGLDDNKKNKSIFTLGAVTEKASNKKKQHR